MYKKGIFILLIYFIGSVETFGANNILLSQEIKTSDIRLEIVSEINTLEEDIKELETKYRNAKSETEKKLLKNKIETLKERLKVLKKQLKDYNQNIDNVG